MGTPEARICLSWCRQNGVKAIVMMKPERPMGGELGGRKPSRNDWSASLMLDSWEPAPMRSNQTRHTLREIHFGYNVVNNDYFAKEAKRFKHEDGSLNSPLLQASNLY